MNNDQPSPTEVIEKKVAMTKPTDPVTGFADASSLEWLDITSEQFREYVYPDGSVYRIDQPQALHVKQKPEGDSHRVIAQGGMSHYVKPGWNAIRWKVWDGCRPFDF